MTTRTFFGRLEAIPLTGYVTLKEVRVIVPLLRRRARRRPGTRFLIDCCCVLDFSGFALARLAALRRHLQWQGSDLALARCSDYVKDRLVVPLFEALLAAEPSRELDQAAPY